MDTFNASKKLSNFSSLTDDEIIELFNPANAQSLPEEALNLMPMLTDEHLKVLAKAYPNQATNNSYLILKDTAATGRELYPRSTFANLLAAKNLGGKKTLVALTFTSRFDGTDKSKPSTLRTSPIQDLTTKEGLPGLTTSPIQEAIAQSDIKEANGSIRESFAESVINNEDASKEGVNEPKNEFIKEPDFPDLSSEAAKQADKPKTRKSKPSEN